LKGKNLKLAHLNRETGLEIKDAWQGLKEDSKIPGGDT